MGAVAKISEKQWAKAKLLYENGNSLRKIASETGINHQTINDRAKKEGWKPDRLRRQIEEQARIEANFKTLEKSEQDFVRIEVEKKLEGMQFYSTHARIVSKIALKSLQSDMTPFSAKTTMATLREGLVVEGLVPYYPGSQTMSKTQQIPYGSSADKVSTGIIADMVNGNMPVDLASRSLAAIQAHLKIVEMANLEARIIELENLYKNNLESI